MCNTRWEAKLDSVENPVKDLFEQTCNALEQLIDTSTDNAVVIEPQSLLDALQTMPFLLRLTV